jgi:thioester reductase-like protein
MSASARDRLAGISPAKRELLLRMLQTQRKTSFQPAAPMSVAEMLAEAVLDDDIDPARASAPRAVPETVLLTGATGFIGAFLLDALLVHTGLQVFCLVRAADAAEGARRIAGNLADYGLAAPPPGRVIAVPGDLAAPRLGLAPEFYARLVDEVDIILHCGAAVKWTYPYAALRAANVAGTQEVLRLATNGPLKPVHFISTVGVFSSAEFGLDVVREDEKLEHSGSLAVGYAQSKWVSEKLVRLAGGRGVPFGIYRPNTGPDSRSGAFNTNDYVSQMIRGCIALRSAPALDIPIAGAAIDYAARAIVHLALSRPAHGGTFHLVEPEGVSWREMVRWINLAGYGVELADYADWKQRLGGTVPGGFSLGPFFSEGVFERIMLPRFDNSVVQNELRGTGIICPPPGFTPFAACLADFTRRGFLPPVAERGSA